MRILGIDSAMQEASVALVEDGAILGEERHGNSKRESRESGKRPNNHAEILLPLIETLLAKNSTTLEQLAAIAVSIGPGSFTGLRIGLATAKGLAYGSGRRLVGVSTLLANARRIARGKALVGSVLDARKGEVYCALFRSMHGDLMRMTSDALMPVDTLIQLWKSHEPASGEPFILIGEGAKVYERRFLDGLRVEIVSGSCLSSVASEVAKLGLEEAAHAGTREGVALAPVYLRPAAAEMERKRG